MMDMVYPLIPFPPSLLKPTEPVDGFLRREGRDKMPIWCARQYNPGVTTSLGKITNGSIEKRSVAMKGG